MDPFPQPLFTLICTSLCASTLSLIFATLVINISPLLWVFPAVFIATAAYHATIFLISSAESPGSSRLFSRPNLLAAYTLTCLWMGAFVIIVVVLALLSLGRLVDASKRGVWSLVIPCVCAFAETIAMGLVAATTRKERMRILYAAKWKWRPGHDAIALSQWRSVHHFLYVARRHSKPGMVVLGHAQSDC